MVDPEVRQNNWELPERSIMPANYRPVQIHACIHDDEPCMCWSCQVLWGRLLSYAMETESTSFEQGVLKRQQALLINSKV